MVSEKAAGSPAPKVELSKPQDLQLLSKLALLLGINVCAELGFIHIRVGLHSGPVMGAVVGTLNRRCVQMVYWFPILRTRRLHIYTSIA